MPYRPHTYCHYCGQKHTSESWPRTCGACKQTVWKNPSPVVVALIPTPSGVLLVRRGIEPKLGALALPGGYIDDRETWQEAARREVFEETGFFAIHPDLFALYSVETSILTGNLLVFGRTPTLPLNISDFKPNREVLELKFANEPMELAFDFHTKMLNRHFQEFSRG